MTQYVIDFLQSSLNVDDELVFVAVVIFSIIFISFLLDVFKFILYYISGRK